MRELDEFKDKLRHARPEQWDLIPDIELYMDQVISYMTRQHIGLELDGDENLTSAMINNYIKEGLLPRAEGKKYSRTHLAYLTAICALKQVISVKDVHLLLSQGEALTEDEAGRPDVRRLYEAFRRELGQALNETADSLPEACSRDQLVRVALGLALRSYADRLACQRMLAILSQPDRPEP